jgi:mannose-1-phosphate guanylyltransferase
LKVPKPLFPAAGIEMVWHTIAACAKVPKMKEILLVGFYEMADFNPFIERVEREFQIPIRYLREYQPLGTGGGLFHFKEQILRGRPTDFFVLHSDICCSFPLTDLLEFHSKHPEGLCTVLSKRIAPEFTSNYGCIVKSDDGEILHYAEKPETFVSDLINCGVYIFSPRIFETIQVMAHSSSEE